MARETGRWTLENLVDFEHEIAVSPRTPTALREAVITASRGLDGASARRVGFRVWLDGVGNPSVGGKFLSALAVVANN